MHMKIKLGGRLLDVEVVTVTPELARVWLDRNTGNRNLRAAHVAKLARSMRLGEWEFVGDPIRIAVSGRLLDGQHRLAAVEQSGVTQQMLVIQGLAEDTQQFMDIGKVRSAADTVKLAFPDISYADKWASVARLVIKWDAGDLPGDILTPSSPEIVEFISRNEQAMERAVGAAARVRTALREGSSAVSGAAFFFAEQIDATLAHDFWRKLATGAGIEVGDPAHTLREALLFRRKKDRWNAVEETAAYVRCWNFARTGKTVRKIQLTRGEFTENNFKLR